MLAAQLDINHMFYMFLDVLQSISIVFYFGSKNNYIFLLVFFLIVLDTYTYTPYMETADGDEAVADSVPCSHGGFTMAMSLPVCGPTAVQRRDLCFTSICI